MILYYRTPRQPDGQRYNVDLDVPDTVPWERVCEFIRSRLFPDAPFVPLTNAELAQVAAEAEAGAKAAKKRLGKDWGKS